MSVIELLIGGGILLAKGAAAKVTVAGAAKVGEVLGAHALRLVGLKRHFSHIWDQAESSRMRSERELWASRPHCTASVGR